jgi:hypothetical protein
LNKEDGGRNTEEVVGSKEQRRRGEKEIGRLNSVRQLTDIRKVSFLDKKIPHQNNSVPISQNYLAPGLNMVYFAYFCK